MCDRQTDEQTGTGTRVSTSTGSHSIYNYTGFALPALCFGCELCVIQIYLSRVVRMMMMKIFLHQGSFCFVSYGGCCAVLCFARQLEKTWVVDVFDFFSLIFFFFFFEVSCYGMALCLVQV